MVAIRIEDLMVKDDRTVWLKYSPAPENEFEVEIRYLPRADLARIWDRSQVTKWDKRTHVQVKEQDRESFYKMFIDKVFVGWKGLTVATLAKMIRIKVEDPSVEVPFSAENAFVLMSNAYDFDIYIQQAALDIGNFEEEKTEAEKKTSSMLPSGTEEAR